MSACLFLENIIHNGQQHHCKEISTVNHPQPCSCLHQNSVQECGQISGKSKNKRHCPLNPPAPFFERRHNEMHRIRQHRHNPKKKDGKEKLRRIVIYILPITPKYQKKNCRHNRRNSQYPPALCQMPVNFIILFPLHNLPLHIFLSTEQGLAKPIAMIFVGYDPELLQKTLRGFVIYSFSFLFAGTTIHGQTGYPIRCQSGYSLWDVRSDNRKPEGSFFPTEQPGHCKRIPFMQRDCPVTPYAPCMKYM